MKIDFKSYLEDAWNALSKGKKRSGKSYFDRKTITIFIVCLFLAFSLWMVIHLDQNYNIRLQIPLALGKVSAKQALDEKLPSSITATISGKGWDLIKLFHNPPPVYINVTGEQVNLFQQVRQQVDNQKITVQKVAPFYLQLKLEPRQTKKVPIKSNIYAQFDGQYGFLQKPSLTPDSVTISGGKGRIDSITQWPTDTLSLEDVKKDVSIRVPLKTPGPLISLSPKGVRFHAKVAQLTSGEVTVPVKKQNFPPGQLISFNPSQIHIKYQIPLNEYKDIQNVQLFKAFVSFSQLKNDSTGFLKPQIQQVPQKDHLKIVSVQPREIGYFIIVGNPGG